MERALPLVIKCVDIDTGIDEYVDRLWHLRLDRLLERRSGGTCSKKQQREQHAMLTRIAPNTLEPCARDQPRGS